MLIPEPTRRVYDTCSPCLVLKEEPGEGYHLVDIRHWNEMDERHKELIDRGATLLQHQRTR